MLAHVRPALHGLLPALSAFRGTGRLSSVSETHARHADTKVQSPFAQRILLLLHRYYGLMRQSQPALLYFGMASFEKSPQVATSPCCRRDLPDVISANLSQDAWSPAPAVPQSALACFFPCVIGLPRE